MNAYFYLYLLIFCLVFNTEVLDIQTIIRECHGTSSGSNDIYSIKFSHVSSAQELREQRKWLHCPSESFRLVLLPAGP